MSTIKELCKLVKLMFGSKPKDYELMQLMPMDHFPFKGYRFMMWCGNIVYRSKREAEIQLYLSTARGIESVRHESIHLQLAKLKGSWFKYYTKYIWEWVKGNPISSPASSAYLTIPYEIEAYANLGIEGYDKNYDGSNLPKYNLKNRKKTYKAHRENWKNWIKTL